jgi:type I restriction-modification system DNA methylase subunit
MKITYNDDEVNVFHPAVKEAISKYMLSHGLDTKYDVEHHANLSSVTGIPDFVIKLKSNGKWVFVIEVKRTPNDTKSPEFWAQGRKYVANNPNWEINSPPYFIITNIETTCFLQNGSHITDQTVTQCLIHPGIINTKIRFGETKNDEETIQEFSNNVVPKIFELLGQHTLQGILPASVFAQNFNEILKEFIKTHKDLQNNIQKIMSVDKSWIINFGFIDENDFNQKMQDWKNLHDPQSTELSLEQFIKEFSLDIIFRLFVCVYNKEYFYKNKLFLNIKFPNQIQTNNIQAFFNSIVKIDFRNIFDKQLIDFIPNNMTKENIVIITRFLNSLNKEMKGMIDNNAEPEYVLNRIISEQSLFPRESLNEEGKVMTDPILANFMTTMCFELSNQIPEIFDPCCGTGNFLSYSYDQMKLKNPTLSHNQILSHLHGCEIDGLLAKLGIFGLIMKKPDRVNLNTKIDIRLMDFFETNNTDFKNYDVVLMNPPFIRPDNKRTPLDKDAIENKILRSLKMDSYMKIASQPNLFFYFVEMATCLLKDKGIMSLILPQSFLNTDNGKIIKKFLLKKFEILYIVVIPASFFFQNVDISPCVLILRRSNEEKTNKITFVRISDSKFFDTDVKTNLEQIDNNNKMFVKKRISQNNIQSEDNWREYILPETKYIEIFKTSSNFNKISKKFTVKRGELANEGSGNSWFFPWSTKSVKKYKNFAKDFRSHIKNIENELIKLGIKNSDVVTNCTLSITDLKKQQSLAFSSENNLIDDFPGFKKFKQEFEVNDSLTLPKKWTIDQLTSNSQIIIPRNLRKNLYVAFNPFWDLEKVYFSSNFVMLSNCTLSIKGVSAKQTLKFIAGYLNSSFVQVILEKDGNNREGTRKNEVGSISQIPIPVNSLDSNLDLIKRIGNKFTELKFGLTGEECSGISNPRHELDLAVAELLIMIEPKIKQLGLSSLDLSINAEIDLRTLVEIRKER